MVSPGEHFDLGLKKKKKIYNIYELGLFFLSPTGFMVFVKSTILKWYLSYEPKNDYFSLIANISIGTMSSDFPAKTNLFE